MAFRIFDVSLPLTGKTVVYPGDPRVRVVPRRGKTTFSSDISMSSHAGTHMDAPRHVARKGRGVGELALDRCIGPCRVLDCTRVRAAITADDLQPHRILAGERILVKTQNSRSGFEKWYDDYIWLAPDAADFLARKKIALFGIDAWSVKQPGSLDNRPHTALLARGIPILEGLNLQAVRPGRYFLIALPLRFTGLDGSPMRAVLLHP